MTRLQRPRTSSCRSCDTARPTKRHRGPLGDATVVVSMASDGKAARRALRSAIEGWFWRAAFAEPEAVATNAPVPSIRTELSSTVFSGDARDWVHYLQLSEIGR